MKISRAKAGKEHGEPLRQKNPMKFSRQKTKGDADARRRGDFVKMIRQKSRLRVLFWVSVSLILFASCALFFIPRAGKEILEGKKSTALTIAMVFWALEIGAYLIQGFIGKTRRKSSFQKDIKRPTGRKFNLASIIAFSVAALALAGLVIPIVLGVQNGMLVTSSAALLISALQAGILLNSKNYVSA